MSTTPILNVYHPDDSTLARDVVTMGAMADSVETAMLNLPRKFPNLTALALWTPANGALAYIEDVSQTYQRVFSEWRPIQGRHVIENAAGRTYFGTGDRATDGGSTYMGMSPASEPGMTWGAWLNVDGRDHVTWYKSGLTRYWGDLRVDGKILAGGSNTVLWEGAWYMNNSQVAPLSETVSSQSTGIVLAWSGYSGGAAVNSDWNYVFVPKQHVATNAGNGVQNILMAGSDVIRKYVYVSNTQITGFSANSTAPNNRQVLRRVIGV